MSVEELILANYRLNQRKNISEDLEADTNNTRRRPIMKQGFNKNI